MHAVITGDVWIGPEQAVEPGCGVESVGSVETGRTDKLARTTAMARAALAGSPAVRLTVAEEEALEEAVDRAMEGAVLRPARAPAPEPRAAGAAAREASGRWAAALAVVRGWLGARERGRAMDAHLEGHRDAVRRELLLQDPRLW